MSNDIVWLTIRNNSAFLKTRRHVQKFSTEPFNLTNYNSQRYNGLISKKGVDIKVTDDGKQVEVSTKIPQNVHLPAKATRTTYIRAKNRRGAKTAVANLVNNYKKRDVMPAQRLVSQLLRGPKKSKRLSGEPRTL